jgi:GrpB-like predicted nucleotidyltransferase (UPF0157 family)
MGILIEPYDELWPTRFETLKQSYEEALFGIPLVSIEHVGSTSVPGLWAKPIIDIDIVVKDEHYYDAISALEHYGYESRGERGIEGRWTFEAVNALYETNTYVIEENSVALKNHLAVRNVLRRDSSLRDEYSAVKQVLVTKTSDIDVYIHGKTEVLQRVLKLGGLREDELEAIAAANRN